MNRIKTFLLVGVMSLGIASAAMAATTPAATEQGKAVTMTAEDMKAQSLYEAHRAKMMPLHNKLSAKMMEFNAIQNLNSTTKEDIKAMVAEITALREEMYKENNEFLATLKKENLDGYMHRGGMMGGMGMMGGKGGCGGMMSGEGYHGGGHGGDMNGGGHGGNMNGGGMNGGHGGGHGGDMNGGGHGAGHRNK